MEILLTTLTLLTLTAIGLLVITRGKPSNLFPLCRSAFTLAAANRNELAITLLLIFLTAAFLYLFYLTPGADTGPAQPIAFSHRLHAGHKAIDCRFCHPYVAHSIHPGLPPVEKCLYCHDHIISNHPEIRKEHNYFNTNTPTPWRKIMYLPEHVLFNHQRHIKKEIACESCHGQVKAMDRLKTKKLKMGFCLKCHRERDAPIGCWLSCHN